MWKLGVGCGSAPAIITGTLPSFVFLIATIPFVREHSYKCINPCWRALKASCGLPVDSDKKPCQVDQPLVSSLHCLWQIWRLKYTHNSKALSVLHKLHVFYLANVMNIRLIFFFFYSKHVDWNLCSVKSSHEWLLINTI